MKPATPKGTRDISPAEMVKRNFIFDTCSNAFQKYGYLQIETPAMENRDILSGKYGDEGDKLIFNILNSGDFLSKVPGESLGNAASKNLVKHISEKALRYDLTVPFARYVVQHQNDITFPFKRYQIQPVWRADRPQKGRYREFCQCDIDVIGSGSLLNELELLQIIEEVLSKLGLEGISIGINNRKILSGLAEKLGLEAQFEDMVIALDKMDKIGIEGVEKELVSRSIHKDSIDSILAYTKITDLKQLRSHLKGTAAEEGIDELEFILGQAHELKLKNVKFDASLARGLDYYTGVIIEVKSDKFPGSICAGGRYDDLTGLFGMKGLSGVGVSFGADRIFDLMAQENLFPEELSKGPTVLFVNFGEAEALYSLKLVSQLREDGISAELYPDPVKLKKQMSYANDRGVTYVALIGSDEITSGKFVLKNMETGEQAAITPEDLLSTLS